MVMTKIRPFLERLLSNIEKVDGCWLYTGLVAWNGYGLISERLQDGTYKRRRAHRASYEHFVGPIPKGHDLDHLCRNRSCINPEHLEPVTRQENLRRGEHNNRGRTHCRRGHKFTEANTYIIKTTGSRQCMDCVKLRTKGLLT